jgi:hypothetical protein
VFRASGLPLRARAGAIPTGHLVSNQSGEALRTDANLVNPWGLVPGPTGVFWVANEGTGTSTLYNPDGTIVPLVVTIPGGNPTGVVLTSASDSSFRISVADSTTRDADLRRRGTARRPAAERDLLLEAAPEWWIFRVELRSQAATREPRRTPPWSGTTAAKARKGVTKNA